MSTINNSNQANDDVLFNFNNVDDEGNFVEDEDIIESTLKSLNNDFEDDIDKELKYERPISAASSTKEEEEDDDEPKHERSKFVSERSLEEKKVSSNNQDSLVNNSKNKLVNRNIKKNKFQNKSSSKILFNPHFKNRDNNLNLVRMQFQNNRNNSKPFKYPINRSLGSQNQFMFDNMNLNLPSFLPRNNIDPWAAGNVPMFNNHFWPNVPPNPLNFQMNNCNNLNDNHASFLNLQMNRPPLLNNNALNNHQIRNNFLPSNQNNFNRISNNRMMHPLTHQAINNTPNLNMNRPQNKIQTFGNNFSSNQCINSLRFGPSINNNLNFNPINNNFNEKRSPSQPLLKDPILTTPNRQLAKQNQIKPINKNNIFNQTNKSISNASSNKILLNLPARPNTSNHEKNFSNNNNKRDNEDKLNNKTKKTVLEVNKVESSTSKNLEKELQIDEEYLKKLEDQQRKRNEILRLKEERRKLKSGDQESLNLNTNTSSNINKPKIEFKRSILKKKANLGVVIKNLPLTCKIEDVVQLCKKVGPTKELNITIKNNDKNALIIFEKKEDAITFQKKYNFYMFENSLIKVEFV